MIPINLRRPWTAALLSASIMLALCPAPQAAAMDAGCNQVPAIRDLMDSRDDGIDTLAEAKQKIDATLRADPNCAPAFRELARYYILKAYTAGVKTRGGYLMSAQVALDSALRLNPDDAGAHVLYGHLHQLANRSGQAHAALDKAEKLGTDDPWLPLYRAELLSAEGRTDEAGKLYRSMIERRPGNQRAMGAAFDGLIRGYMEKGDLGNADLTHQEKIAFEPDSAQNYGRYASFLLHAQGNYENAITMGRKALQVKDDGEGRKTLAAALYRKWAHHVIEKKDPAGGQPYFDEAYGLFPDIESIKEDAKLSTHTRLTLDAFEQLKSNKGGRG